MAEMDYCGPLGIEWEEFLSWSSASRDAAILWQQRQRQLCSGCGTHPDDWDPERGGHLAAWVATTSTCRGCAAVEARQERLAKEREKTPVRGESVVLRRQVQKGGGG